MDLIQQHAVVRHDVAVLEVFVTELHHNGGSQRRIVGEHLAQSQEIAVSDELVTAHPVRQGDLLADGSPVVVGVAGGLESGGDVLGLCSGGGEGVGELLHHHCGITASHGSHGVDQVHAVANHLIPVDGAAGSRGLGIQGDGGSVQTVLGHAAQRSPGGVLPLDDGVGADGGGVGLAGIHAHDGCHLAHDLGDEIRGHGVHDLVHGDGQDLEEAAVLRQTDAGESAAVVAVGHAAILVAHDLGAEVQHIVAPLLGGGAVLAVGLEQRTEVLRLTTGVDEGAVLGAADLLQQQHAALVDQVLPSVGSDLGVRAHGERGIQSQFIHCCVLLLSGIRPCGTGGCSG